MSSAVQMWGVSHQGLIRRRNEDSLGATGLRHESPDGECWSIASQRMPVLAVVADGLGGHPCGDLASQIAVKEVLASEPFDGASLASAVTRANADVFRRMKEVEGCGGMGTTLAALLVTDGGLAVANVGDSAVFELIDGRLAQLSVDDTPAGTLPGVSISTLTQSLGGRNVFSNVDVHIYEDEHTGPRRLLICSDGLTDYVSRQSIADSLGCSEPASVVGELLDLALNAGGKDNITIILVQSS